MTTDLERAARALIYAWDNADEHNDPDSALEVLRAALPAEGATGARGASDRASDKWRGREEIAARDYWHAHANGQPICEPWLDGWLSRAKAHPAPADAGAVEKDLFAWLDAQVGEGRGFVGLSLTENGGVGCWLPEDGIPDDAESRPVPEGESVQEAIRLRMERHKAHRAGRPA